MKKIEIQLEKTFQFNIDCPHCDTTSIIREIEDIDMFDKIYDSLENHNKSLNHKCSHCEKEFIITDFDRVNY